jgi:hypothetical protein
MTLRSEALTTLLEQHDGLREMMSDCERWNAGAGGRWLERAGGLTIRRAKIAIHRDIVTFRPTNGSPTTIRLDEPIE